MKKNNFSDVVFVFDGKGENFRKKIYPSYKSNRPKMPEDLIVQMQEIKSHLAHLGLTYLQLDSNEADDVISSFIETFKSDSYYFYIFTRDKDMMQLIDNKVSVVKYSGKCLINYGYLEFVRDYNFEPKNYVDYLSILGDKSDNIDGIKGIGPVTSRKLIKEFGNVESICKKVQTLPEKVKVLIEGNEKQLIDNKLLVNLRRYLIFPRSLKEYSTSINNEKISKIKLFLKEGLKKML